MQGRRLTLAALALLVSTQSMAKTAKMLLEFCVNGGCYGTAFVVAEDKRILVDEEAVKRANLPVEDLKTVRRGERSFVDVTALGGGATAKLDASHGKLDLVLPATDFAGNTIDVKEQKHRLVPTAMPSAFMNYAVNLGFGTTSQSVYLDAGVAYGQALLRDDPSWNRQQGFMRGMSRLEYDDADNDRRYTLGDQYAYSTDGLGGTTLLGGIGITRAFDLDPYLITFPQPTIAGVLQAPGTVDVYENGVLVSQKQVPAGPFNLASLGLGAGSNDVRVVVQDPFGGTSVLQQNFYGASAMLGAGLTDYAYQIGFERISPLFEGYEAQHPALLARENYGVTGYLTAGARVEAEPGLVNGGPSLNLRLPFGVLSGGVSGSHTRQGDGFATSLAYQFSNRNFSFGAGIQGFSGEYRRIGDDELPPSFRPRRIGYANASWAPLQRLNLSLSAGDTAYADGTRQDNFTATAQYNFAGNLTGTLNFTRTINHPGGAGSQITFNLIIPLGRNSFGASVTRDSQYGNEYGFSAQRSVPSDSGFGYSVNGQYGQGGVAGVSQVTYQSQYGLAQLSGQRFDGQASGNLLVSGSVVAMDGHVFAARALQNGYALVETPGVPGVQITQENQPIGKTDSNGNLLVTNLLPYQANRVGLNQETVPMDDQIDATDKIISVPRLGGTVVRFGVRRLHAARGTLTLGGKPVQFGTGRVATKEGAKKTLIGIDGGFYFFNLAPGSYELRALTASGNIVCPLKMPANARALTRLGQIACQLAGSRPP